MVPRYSLLALPLIVAAFLLPTPHHWQPQAHARMHPHHWVRPTGAEA